MNNSNGNSSTPPQVNGMKLSPPGTSRLITSTSAYKNAAFPRSPSSSAVALTNNDYFRHEQEYRDSLASTHMAKKTPSEPSSVMTPSDIDSETESDIDLPREALGFGGVGTSFDDEYIDNVTSYPFLEASYNHEQMENDESLPERLEWQAMLASVITGEVVRSEKRRLKTNTDASMKEDDLWMEIRARMCGRTFEDQKRVIEDARVGVEATLQEIMQFRVSNPDDMEQTLAEVNATIVKLENCEQLWQTRQLMKTNSTLYRDPEFQRFVEALTTWVTITEWIIREIHLLQVWTGNTATDPTLQADTCNSKADSIIESTSLVDRVLKQEDLMKVFDEKIKSNIGPVIERAREGHLQFRKEFKLIGLPVHVEGLEKLMKFPIKLIQALVSQRLVYAKKMTNPTVMLVDQTIEDLSLYMNIALLVKERNAEYTTAVPDVKWINYKPDPKFDETILDCVNFFFTLSKSKFDYSMIHSHIGFKEIDKFESQYYFLEQVGRFVDGGAIVVAIHSSSLVMKMCSKLLMYWEHQTKNPSCSSKVEVERWYTYTTERIRKAQRKLLRFYK
ncbi:hypothetical protein DV113_002266 [Geotrichum candidum]|nr:hypothetical protein DV454_003254 [Geotrichum candidum]KAF5116240.1 hypothetical protein DV452_002707 [Geotrichum candidum]KAF7499680.1 hypothetical protein DV113_002266 [Geotrichum candidum]KAI9214614.1 hypothetical protein DS838_000564 [Geotrichum bryndzae]